MGSTSSVVDQAQNQEDAQQFQDCANALTDLLETKAATFFASLPLPVAKELPVNKAVLQDKQSYFRKQDDSSMVEDAVSSIVSDFAHKDWLNGVKTGIVTAINMFFGSMCSSTAEDNKYVVFIDDYGGIGRLDFLMYSYSYTSQQMLKTDVTSAFLVAYSYSSIKTDTLDTNMIRNLLQVSYGANPVEEVQSMFDYIVDTLHEDVAIMKKGAITGIGPQSPSKQEAKKKAALPASSKHTASPQPKSRHELKKEPFYYSGDANASSSHNHHGDDIVVTIFYESEDSQTYNTSLDHHLESFVDPRIKNRLHEYDIFVGQSDALEMHPIDHKMPLRDWVEKHRLHSQGLVIYLYPCHR